MILIKLQRHNDILIQYMKEYESIHITQLRCSGYTESIVISRLDIDRLVYELKKIGDKK